MEVFELVEEMGHEQVVFCHDENSGLKAIIAIHDTTLGPSLGGTRMWDYDSEEEALVDVLRLSKGMTYKSSAMGLNLGGGKAVIIGDPQKDKSEELWRAFGRFVDSLGGRYITAEDVGTAPEDMDFVAEETEHVCGLMHKSGDPSPVTAYGTYVGIKACCQWMFDSDDLEGITVAVQGIGSVGYALCEYLHEEGANLLVSDIYPERVEEVVEKFNAEEVNPDDIYGVDCDVFAPCALGAIINDDTIDELKCSIVAGAANNQLAEDIHGEQLRERGILYAPDYVINGGGVINVAHEFYPGGYKKELALRKVEQIYDRLLEVFHTSEEEGIPTNEAADAVAKARIEKIAQVKRIRV